MLLRSVLLLLIVLAVPYDGHAEDLSERDKARIKQHALNGSRTAIERADKELRDLTEKIRRIEDKNGQKYKDMAYQIQAVTAYRQYYVSYLEYTKASDDLEELKVQLTRQVHKGKYETPEQTKRREKLQEERKESHAAMRAARDEYAKLTSTDLVYPHLVSTSEFQKMMQNAKRKNN